MRARAAVHGADPSKPFSHEVHSAFERVLEIGLEFQKSLAQERKRRRGRPPTVGIDLAIEAMFARGFSDAQIRNLLQKIRGEPLNEQYVTRRRQEAKIRRREPSGPPLRMAGTAPSS
jgi:hypothetical protein